MNQALVSATTVEDLQRSVVETLATPGLYDDVWLSTTATDGSPVRMRASDDAPATADPDAAPSAFEPPDAPAASDTAVPTGAEPALDGGDWTTVPLVYGQTVYGAIALHTDRETGFGERELDVLDEFGETIGHALTAIERTHLLVADTHVELDLQSTNEDALLFSLADETGTEWSLDGLVPAKDGDLVAYLATGTDEVDCVAAATSHPGVTEVRSLATDSGTTLEVRASRGTLAHPLVESGANVQSATTTDGRCRLTAQLSPDANVRTVVERVQAEFPATELLAKREIEPTEQETLPDEDGMTDRQREALEAAFRAGYFDWPRESTAEEVADSLDIASSTLHSHLRKAEGQLLETFFEAEG